jgi:hypothetical protein
MPSVSVGSIACAGKRIADSCLQFLDSFITTKLKVAVIIGYEY